MIFDTMYKRYIGANVEIPHKMSGQVYDHMQIVPALRASLDAWANALTAHIKDPENKFGYHTTVINEESMRNACVYFVTTTLPAVASAAESIYIAFSQFFTRSSPRTVSQKTKTITNHVVYIVALLALLGESAHYAYKKSYHFLQTNDTMLFFVNFLNFYVMAVVVYYLNKNYGWFANVTAADVANSLAIYK
jgi:hypothetical protein